MSQSRNLREIQKVIDELGIASVTRIVRSSKSIAVIISGINGTRKFFAACTPSDCRNHQNMKRDMKRVAVEAGALSA